MDREKKRPAALHYDARAHAAWAAPVGWTAIINGETYFVAMFCLVTWYDGGARSDHASLVSYRGRMVLAEQQDGFESINPPQLLGKK